MRSPGFWQDREGAQKVSEELAHLKDSIRSVEKISKEVDELEEFASYAESDKDIGEELEGRISALLRIISKEETAVFLSGPYDRNNAIITIYSGAGGRDAQDWAGILLRMYERYDKGVQGISLGAKLRRRRGYKGGHT